MCGGLNFREDYCFYTVVTSCFFYCFAKFMVLEKNVEDLIKWKIQAKMKTLCPKLLDSSAQHLFL